MFRKVLVGVTRHGRKAFQKFCQKGDVPNPKPGAGQKNPEIRDVRHGPHIHRVALTKVQDALAPKGYLTQQLVKYARQNLASELRRQFNRTPIYREYSGLASKLSMFAFVGVGFASRGNTSEERFDSICGQIKGIFERDSPTCEEQSFSQNHGVDNYHFGPMIAKGCNAAVYQAKSKLRDRRVSECADSETDVDSDDTVESDDGGSDSDIEMISDRNVSDSFVMLDNEEMEESTIEHVLMDPEPEDDISVLDQSGDEEAASIMFVVRCQREADKDPCKCESISADTNSGDSDFDLAIKMMFNYDTESNASALYREMRKEMVPAKVDFDPVQITGWENGHRAKKKGQMPPHPNIVDMDGAFVDEVPWLPGCTEEYPHALPHRLSPDGLGRNKTLFLVMKRYPQTLREYLKRDISMETSMLLLTQLVEAVVHMANNGIAHRDLKSDNIFVEDVDSECPRLVVSDFGECLCVNRGDPLRLPYTTDEMSKGGNITLMAPEVLVARAGPGLWLDYSKSDIWAVGTLAYEIFGLSNPFYRSSVGDKLHSDTYSNENLPSLPEVVPMSIQHVIRLMLERNPAKRPSASLVSTMLHTILWGAEEWDLTTTTSTQSVQNPGRRDVMRWLLTLTAQGLFEKALGRVGPARDLRRLFLAHLDFEEVMCGMDLITQQ